MKIHVLGAVLLLFLLSYTCQAQTETDHGDEDESVHQAEEVIAMFDENDDAMLEDHELEEALHALASGTTTDAHAGHDHRRRLQLETSDDIDEHADEDEHNEVTAESLLTKYGGDDGLMAAEELAESAMEIVGCQLNDDCHLGEEEVDDEHVGDGVKAAAIIIILLEALIGGLIPFCLKMRVSDSAMCHMNAFTAGVFLATGVTHLLPHAVEGFATVDFNDYPMAYVVTLIGYFMVLAAEEVARAHSGAMNTFAPTDRNSTDGSSRSEVDAEMQQEAQQLEYSTVRHASSAIIAAASLSMHSVFAGIALGLQSTDEDMWKMVAVIASHKGLAAFALGTKLLQAKFSTKTAVGIIVAFSLVTPTGTLIGFALSHMSEVSRAVLDALSAGIFVYLGSNGAEKDIGEESHEIEDKMGKKQHRSMMRGLYATEYTVLAIGAALMCALNAVESGLGGHAH